MTTEPQPSNSEATNTDSHAAKTADSTKPTDNTETTKNNMQELASAVGPKKRTIKIGSQRENPGLASSQMDSASNEESPKSDVTSASSVASEETKKEAGEVSDSSQPSDDEAPVTPSSTRTSFQQSDSYFPQPVARSSSAELEDEIAAALGDKSLDELITAEDAATLRPILEPETRLTGSVIKVHRENVFFSLGGRDEGIAPLKQFNEPPDIGAQMEVTVVKYDAGEGLYELTIPGAAMSVGDWSDISEGIVVEARVTGHNSGGLECDVNNLRGFIPVSQIALFRVEDLEQFVDQRLQCVVMEANPQRRNLVLSHRALLERENEASRQQLLQELEIGQIREGVVRRIQDFGAFVDLGGVDGLVHISKLSWDRVNHPSDVLQEGQKIQVRVEKIDQTTGKIALSYRDTTTHPWETVEDKYFTGTTVSGTVSRLAKFGAFVRLEAGIEGLVHISELAHHRVQKVNSIVKEGQEVEVKVLSVDQEAQRMSLSLKALISEVPEESSEGEDDTPDEPLEPTVPSFKGELKGGTNRPTGGDQFGLNW